MKLVLASALVGLLAAPSGVITWAVHSSEPALVSARLRVALRGLVRELALLGLAEEMTSLRALLLEMGDTPQEHARLDRGWMQDLARAQAAKKDPKQEVRVRKSLIDKLGRFVRDLETELQKLDADRGRRLAPLVLALSAESGPAHKTIGHVEHDGVWLSEQARTWQTQAARVDGLVRAARSLEVEVTHAASTLAPAQLVYGADAHVVTAHGIELHGGIPAERLERVLREALRAAALSHALLGSELALPKLKHGYRILMLQEEEHYDRLLEEAHGNGGIPQAEYDLQRQRVQRSFSDARGWRTSRWRVEADLQAIVLWTVLYEWLGRDAQPCFEAGHLNWITVAFFGTAMPLVNVIERQSAVNGTSAKRATSEDLLRLAATRTLFGCKAWMRARMRAGDRFPYARALVDQVGKIQDEVLLKATLMNEYLQVRGELRALVDATQAKTDRAGALETALGRTLPALEAEWEAWLMGESFAPGLLQRLGGDAGSSKVGGGAPEGVALEKLRSVRAAALEPLGVWFAPVDLFDDLSASAQAHARYLDRNRDQWDKWPDAHEEYPDREGYSPQGNWAGLHSVIHFVADPAEAIEGWLGTFFHRLPLLDPGLFGVGLGQQGKVTVLDTNSLVIPYYGEAWVAWPAQDAKDVPRRFHPELPNPVPGEDQSQWGYPITIQAYWGDKKQEQSIEMALFRGSRPTGEPIACHFLTPTSAPFKKLVPTNAYCLIPKAHLAAGETYTVRATSPTNGATRVWSFKTGR